MIRAIFACDSQGGISKNGVMPWPRNQSDLQHFRSLTTGSVVVMGRNTWEAVDMPSPLPKRTNIVVTTNQNYNATGATVISQNIPEYLTSLSKSNTVFVIGGANLFTQLIDQIQVLHLTRISGNYDCDTFLPLDQIQEKFLCVDRYQVNNLTAFETHIAK